ncbi:hypothetical protein ACT80S_17020 [Ramlibacter sp. MAHUQ-53]
MLADPRTRGYSVVQDTQAHGMSSMAAPVRRGDGLVLAGLDPGPLPFDVATGALRAL